MDGRLIAIVLFVTLSAFSVSCKKRRHAANNVRVFSKVYPPSNYKITGAIIDNKKEGLWTTCDSSGRIESEETFINGKSFGEAKVYDNGKLVVRTKDTIVDNDTISKYEKYNVLGRIIVNGQYVNGAKKGIWTSYQEDGRSLKDKIDYEKTGVKVIFKDTVRKKSDF
jgi:antitoxin component YwqK of YwqJK toxin-antitoxin module